MLEPLGPMLSGGTEEPARAEPPPVEVPDTPEAPHLSHRPHHAAGWTLLPRRPRRARGMEPRSPSALHARRGLSTAALALAGFALGRALERRGARTCELEQRASRRMQLEGGAPRSSDVPAALRVPALRPRPPPGVPGALVDWE